jgi:hypothetical protein
MKNSFYRTIIDNIQLGMKKYKEENNKIADDITCSELLFWMIDKVSEGYNELLKLQSKALFKVECIESTGMFDITTVGNEYYVIEESDTQYTILDDCNDLGKYQKTKFKRIK